MEQKTKRVFRPAFWGIVLILAAAVLILDGVGVSFGYDITPLRAIIGILLVAWLIYVIVRLKFTDIFFPLAFLFITFEGTIANALGKGDDLISNWVVLLAALLLTIGCKAIFPSKSTATRAAVCKPGIGNQTLYFDAADLTGTEISQHVGNIQVYLFNCEAYPGNGVISICQNAGNITLHLPRTWRVVTQVSENLGRISVPSQEGEFAKEITLIIQQNVGNIHVIFD